MNILNLFQLISLIRLIIFHEYSRHKIIMDIGLKFSVNLHLMFSQIY